MRTKTRKTGSRRDWLVALSVLVAGPAATGRDRKPKSKPFALIAGTVFRDTGFALPGAKVTLEARPESGQEKVKIKKIEAISDVRGEFAVRVAPVPMRYTVSVSAKGFKPDRKEVQIQGEERAELFFRLVPESD